MARSEGSRDPQRPPWSCWRKNSTWPRTCYPAAIGKAFSHGCVRLTNWDAEELAHAVGKGVDVAFSDDDVALVAGDSQSAAPTAGKR